MPSLNPFSKLRDTIGDLRRFRMVVTVLFEEGFSFLVDETGLRYLVPLRSRFKQQVRRGARVGGRVFGIEFHDLPPEVRLRRAFERLGPTFMKLGQLLSVRTDIIPAEYARELSKLQDRGPVLMPGTAEKIVERELGKPMENVFAEFELKPMAAASLAQVHRAKLRDGRRVAVKVRRPGIVETIVTDIRILAFLAQALESHLPAVRRLRPVRLAREFADWTMRELDFSVEGAHMDMFRENLAAIPEAVIPKVHWECVTPSLLVTELIEGIKVDDFDALDRAKVNRHELALLGLKIGLRQFLVNGVFHGDPHPGNMTVMPPRRARQCPVARERRGGEGDEPLPLRLGIYDFGMIGRVPEEQRMEMISCFVSFLEKDTDSYVRHVLDLAEIDEGADVKAFESETRDVLAGVLYKPLEKKSLATAFFRVLVAGAKHGIFFPSDLVLLAKAFVTTENIGIALYPDLDLEKELRPFLDDIMREELSPGRAVSAIKTSAFDTLHFLRRLPEMTQALFDRLESGEVGVKLNLQELRDLKEEFDRQNDVRVLAVIGAALLIASAVALRVDARAAALGFSLGQIGFLVSFAVVVWLFILIRRRP